MYAWFCGFVLLFSAGLTAAAGRDIELGKAFFRSNCAFCHGLNGRGGRGPDLVAGRLTHGSGSEEMKDVIRNGVPGSSMPAFDRMEDEEINNVILYLRSLEGANQKRAPLPGDAIRGRQVYERNGCSTCHRIGSEGSIFGPELTRIGAGRSTEYIRESIVEPSRDVPQDYEGVTVVMRDGKRITGLRVNEDTFTLQVRDASQNFRMFRKDELKEVLHESQSLMPSYRSLPKGDLEDLCAYLDSLRG